MIRAAYYSFACAALCAVALLILTACNSFNAPAPVLQRHASIINVRIDPALPTLGMATWQGDLCTITLRQYPVCLAHEVRHCLEGDWHAGKNSTEDC